MYINVYRSYGSLELQCPVPPRLLASLSTLHFVDVAVSRKVDIG